MTDRKPKAVRMWIGVDPENDTPLPWSLSKTRGECRSALDSMRWGAGRVRRVTLLVEQARLAPQRSKT